MQAIYTKYLERTNHRPPRYKATTTQGDSVTLDKDYSLDTTGNKLAAISALLRKMGWSGVWVAGAGGDVAVCVEYPSAPPARVVTDWDYTNAQHI